MDWEVIIFITFLILVYCWWCCPQALHSIQIKLGTFCCSMIHNFKRNSLWNLDFMKYLLCLKWDTLALHMSSSCTCLRMFGLNSWIWSVNRIQIYYYLISYFWYYQILYQIIYASNDGLINFFNTIIFLIIHGLFWNDTFIMPSCSDIIILVFLLIIPHYNNSI